MTSGTASRRLAEHQEKLNETKKSQGGGAPGVCVLPARCGARLLKVR